MPTTSSPSILTKLGTVIDEACRKRWGFIDTFDRLPALAAAADLNGTFDDAEVEITQAANLAWSVDGGGALAPTFSTGGGIVLDLGTSSGNETVIAPHDSTGGNAVLSTVDFSTADELAFYAQIKTSAVLADTTIGAGWKLVPGTLDNSTDDDQLYVRYQDSVNGGKFQIVSSNGASTVVDEQLDTGITVAASTTYEIVIELREDKTATVWIATDYDDFVEVGTTQALGVADDADLLPFVGIEANSATNTATLTVRKVALSKLMND